VSSLAGRDKDSGADYRAYAKTRELHGPKHAEQPVLARHFIKQQLERLLRQKLTAHSDTSRDLFAGLG